MVTSNNARRKIVKKAILILSIVSLVMIFLVIGCGGGGGGGGGTAPPTKAVVKVSSVGPSTTVLFGAQATVHLPTGVSVKTYLNSTLTATDVVVASGVSTQAYPVLGTYNAVNGTVNVYVFKATGFPTGEFATIDCDIATGVKPQASDFSVTDLLVSDSTGTFISGLQPSISVSFH